MKKQKEMEQDECEHEDGKWCEASHPVLGRRCIRLRNHSGSHISDGIPQAEWATGEVERNER